MNTLSSIAEVRTLIQRWRTAGQRIGFVPSMGNLHEGHLSLVRKAKEVCDRVVVSIYVNPLQFGEGEDFQNYPRTLEADREKLDNEKVDLLFYPDDKTMYPEGREKVDRIEVPAELDSILEGASRPDHFRGVATVVKRLFDIVQPDVAVFGEKDFQQLLVIRHLVKQFDLPIEIIGMPTLREADGLAMSSRNGYLSLKERQRTPVLYETLRVVRERLLAGAGDYEALEKEGEEQLRQQGFEPDYVVIRNAHDLGMPVKGNGIPLIILVAARLGKPRLIDNLRI